MTNLPKTPRQRLRAGIESFLHSFPMFANIALKWELVETTELARMATDGKKLLYNPDFVTENTSAENAWVILHEAFHVWLGHHLRMLGKVPGVANIAFDLAISCLINRLCPSERLRKMVVEVGVGDYVDFPPDKDAETYYARLTQPESPQTSPGESDSDDPSEDTSEQSGCDQDKPGETKDKPEESSDTQSGQSQGDGESDENAGNGPASDSEAGEGVGTPSGDQNASEGQPGPGKGQPGGQSDVQYEGLGDVLPCPDVNTPAEKAAAEGEWQEIVAESVALGDMCGNCPGWFKALSEKLLGKSEVDWRLVLRRFLTKYVPSGSTFNKPNRRSAWRKDVILPAHRSKGGGNGMILADVSGSIFDKINEAVLPEIEKILTTLPRTTVDLVQVDTEVRAERALSRYDFPLRMPLDWKGGGGTDLNPGFVKAKKEAAKHRWVICITDMVWAWPSAVDPHIPVLWIVVDRESFDEKVPFGRVVAVNR